MDNYIAYKPEVWFKNPSKTKTKFSPYSDILVYLSEVHYCPFCGKVFEGTHKMCCSEFDDAFTKLLQQNGASDRMYYSIGNDTQEHGSNLIRRPVTDIQSCLLKKSEVKDFDVDFWDFSKMHNVCGKRGFRFANPSYEDGVLKFYWKDLETKSVFLCSLQGLHIGAYEIIFLKKCVWEDGHPKYENLTRFSDWNELCEALKKV